MSDFTVVRIGLAMGALASAAEEMAKAADEVMERSYQTADLTESATEEVWSDALRWASSDLLKMIDALGAIQKMMIKCETGR